MRISTSRNTPTAQANTGSERTREVAQGVGARDGRGLARQVRGARREGHHAQAAGEGDQAEHEVE
ncbi:hypothetical protein ACWEOE_34445 [Amycolatopsis sp. NPDC004368]